MILAAGLVFALILSFSLDSYSENLKKKNSKISSALSYAMEENELDAENVVSRSLVSTVRKIDDEGNIRVYIKLYEFSIEYIEKLKENKVVIEIYDESQKLVQGKVANESVEFVSNLSFVKFVDLPNIGFTNSGSVQTEGDVVLKADEARSSFGVDGTGIKVAAFSDGIDGLTESIASGDMPTAGIMVPSSPLVEGGVSVDDPCPVFIPVTSTPEDREDITFGSEGLAMLEIIHDLAPGAELFFASPIFEEDLTSLAFRRAKKCLTEAVDIIADDIGFYNEGPYDGTSTVSLQSTASVQAGVANFISVGNEGEIHYQGLFSDTNDNSFHEYDVSLGINDGDPIELYVIELEPFDETEIFLQWNDPFGGSNNNYDMLVNCSDDTTYTSENVQDGDDNPTEQVNLISPYDFSIICSISIYDFLKFNGIGSAEPRVFDLFHDGSPAVSTDFVVPESSVTNNPDADLVCSVGAVGIGPGDLFEQSPDEIRDYSSRGPTSDGRLKPELVAPDGVSITGNGDFDSPFFGTSAAAPHAAGVAALVLQADTSLTPASLTSALQQPRVLSPPLLADILSNTAVDLGPPGPDNTYGFGRIDAFAAVQSVLQPETGPSPTPTNSPPPGESSGSKNGGSCSIAGRASSNSVYVNALMPFTVLLSFGLIRRLRRISSISWLG